MSLLRVDGSKDGNRARARDRTRNARTNAHECKSSHKQMPQIYLCVNKPLIVFNWIESYRHAEQIIADLFCALMIYLMMNTHRRNETGLMRFRWICALIVNLKSYVPLQSTKHTFNHGHKTIASFSFRSFSAFSSHAFSNRFDTANNCQYLRVCVWMCLILEHERSTLVTSSSMQQTHTHAHSSSTQFIHIIIKTDSLIVESVSKKKSTHFPSKTKQYAFFSPLLIWCFIYWFHQFCVRKWFQLTIYRLYSIKVILWKVFFPSIFFLPLLLCRLYDFIAATLEICVMRSSLRYDLHASWTNSSLQIIK